MKIQLRSFLIVAVLSFGGCASMTYDPLLVDSAMPRELVSMQPCTAQLGPGRTCVAQVRAENWYSDTGLRVRPSQSYCIRIPQGQVWFDADRRNSPPVGEAGSVAMNLFKGLRRHDSPWFTLMAGVVDFQKPEKQPAQAIKSLSLRQFERMDGDGLLKVKEAGALVMYPNDASGLEYFYTNNSGQIWVQISHLLPSERCTEAITPPMPRN